MIEFNERERERENVAIFDGQTDIYGNCASFSLQSKIKWYGNTVFTLEIMIRTLSTQQTFGKGRPIFPILSHNF